MLEEIAHFITRYTSRRSSPRARVVWQIAGAILFLIIVPLVLLLIARFLTRRIRAGRNMAARMIAGIPAILLGPALMAWAMYTFLTRGEGTAVPFAAPQRLVTEGPYRFIRNPIQVGVTLFYFGIGCLAESIVAGLTILAIVAVPGIAYHTLIEEKELRMRFGRRYEAYRRRTPFIVPRFPGK
ncbi:MAG: methyltransferase family protein [Candidatus Latescibacterota bacterium]